MAAPIYFKGKTRLGKQTVPWESVFPVGTRHNCEKCSLCCHSRVGLTEKDLERLKDNSLEERATYLPQSSIYSPIGAAMKTEGGICTNLSCEGLCDIYGVRPLICQSYPLIVAAGFDDDLVVNIALRCPLVDAQTQPEIKKSDIEGSIKMYKRYVDYGLQRSMVYRKTLADHIRAAYPPAFLPREQKLEFMDQAIELLQDVKEPTDMVNVLRHWSDQVTLACNKVIINEYNGVALGGKQNKEIMSNIPPVSDIKFDFTKKRWKNIFFDLDNTLSIYDGSKINKVAARAGWRMKVGGKAYSWGKLKGLVYSDEAVKEVLDYLKLMVRRPSFQLTVAYEAEYLVDFKRMTIIDYALETLLLSNAVIVYLDPIARALGVVNEHEKVEKEDVMMAISNIDAQLLTSLSSMVFVTELKNKIDNVLA